MVFLVDQNVESQKTTFDVVIILNAIGKIRTSKTKKNSKNSVDDQNVEMERHFRRSDFDVLIN